MTTTGHKSKNELVQLKLPVDVKNKLDDIFAKDGTTTPQALKMIATQLLTVVFPPLLPFIMNNIVNLLVLNLRQNCVKMN
ncbi:hypothetical protein E0K97_03615 [Lactobacillus agilis]|uniref:hypothetical protein n=1 Tax=Ligilactobacillus agilis TaxID=1601 RepID=UPI00142FDF76|nr:hypothetical protein [Ligilactobacillus agilis]NJE32194.1 hypothetical protein [Ligilactobacillus agilis]